MQVTENQRIVAAVDGSDNSIAALKYAARLAAALGEPLEVVTTWSYPPYSAPYTVAQWDPARDAQEVLDDSIRAAFGAEPPSAITSRVYPGPAPRALIDLSDTAGMLVLGSRGRGGFAGLLLGSVSTACAAHARCPVVIVHLRPDVDLDDLLPGSTAGA